jgi:hypothetical protein
LLVFWGYKMLQPNLAELLELRSRYFSRTLSPSVESRYIFLCMYILYGSGGWFKLSLVEAVEVRMAKVADTYRIAEFESIDQLYEKMPPEIEEGLKLWKATYWSDAERSLRFWRRIHFLDEWIKELQDAS